MISLELATSLEPLEAAREEWWELWRRCPGATPFQTPDWLLAWWRFLGHGELWAVLLREHGRLAGVGPFFLTRRTLSLLGAGITDYLDVLIEPGLESAGARMFLERVAAQASLWDRCDFQDLPPGSPLLAAGVPAGLAAEVSDWQSCPVLALPESVEDFRAGLCRGLRQNVLRYRRQLERAGEVRFETAGRAALDEALNSLFRLHEMRWGRRNQRGVLSDSAIRSFHRAVSASLLDRGCLRLHTLRVNGSIAAVLYSFSSGRRVYAYLSGFNPAVARFGPGTLLANYAIEEAIREGAREFDFLRGNEAYKYRWGARDRQSRRLILAREGGEFVANKVLKQETGY